MKPNKISSYEFRITNQTEHHFKSVVETRVIKLIAGNVHISEVKKVNTYSCKIFLGIFAFNSFLRYLHWMGFFGLCCCCCWGRGGGRSTSIIIENIVVLLLSFFSLKCLNCSSILTQITNTYFWNTLSCSSKSYLVTDVPNVIRKKSTLSNL